MQYKIEWDTAATFDSGAMSNLPVGTAVIDTDCLFNCERIISGLVEGTRYYVRMAAFNAEQQYGPNVVTNPAHDVPREHPIKPSNVALAVASPTALTASWTHNSANTEGHVVEIFTRTEVFTDDGIFSDGHFGRRETQIITTTTTSWDRTDATTHLSGTFTLAHDGDSTAPVTNYALPGKVSVTRGATEILTTEDLTWFLNRGDTIRIGPAFSDSVEYTVSTNTALTFDATRLPLHMGYADDTMNGILAWRKPVTTTLPVTAPAEQLRAALQNLHSVGQVDVVREQTGQVQLSVTTFDAATPSVGAQIVTVTHSDTTLPKIMAGDTVKFTSASTAAYNVASGWTIVSVSGTTGFTFDALEHAGGGSSERLHSLGHPDGVHEPVHRPALEGCLDQWRRRAPPADAQHAHDHQRLNCAGPARHHARQAVQLSELHGPRAAGIVHY